MTNVTLDANGQEFGGINVTINGTNFLFQDFTTSESTNVVELDGDQGQAIAQAFIARPKEISGTSVADGGGQLVQGNEFTHGGTTYIVTETSVSRSNGAFATQSFSARQKLN